LVKPICAALVTAGHATKCEQTLLGRSSIKHSEAAPVLLTSRELPTNHILRLRFTLGANLRRRDLGHKHRLLLKRVE
jgi:hypothetical protein